MSPLKLLYSAMTSKCKIKVGQWTLNSDISIKIPISPKQYTHSPKLSRDRFVKQAISAGMEPLHLLESAMTSKCKIKVGQWTLNSHISIKIPISPKKIKLT